VKTYRRKGHAEHDNQSYVPSGEIDRWARENDPIDRYVKRIVECGWAPAAALHEIDRAVAAEIETALVSCIDDPPPDAASALPGVLAHPDAAPLLWYRRL